MPFRKFYSDIMKSFGNHRFVVSSRHIFRVPTQKRVLLTCGFNWWNILEIIWYRAYLSVFCIIVMHSKFEILYQVLFPIKLY